jgi:flagellar biosynthesis/type III secretory pathway protein FliH
MPPNTFDEILGLEEQFYDDGYKQGLEDGVKAGRIEGRTFGLEKGFEKYVESGRLYGKSLVWANRI